MVRAEFTMLMLLIVACALPAQTATMKIVRPDGSPITGAVIAWNEFVPGPRQGPMSDTEATAAYIDAMQRLERRGEGKVTTDGRGRAALPDSYSILEISISAPGHYSFRFSYSPAYENAKTITLTSIPESSQPVGYFEYNGRDTQGVASVFAPWFSVCPPNIENDSSRADFRPMARGADDRYVVAGHDRLLVPIDDWAGGSLADQLPRDVSGEKIIRIGIQGSRNIVSWWIVVKSTERVIAKVTWIKGGIFRIGARRGYLGEGPEGVIGFGAIYSCSADGRTIFESSKARHEINAIAYSTLLSTQKVPPLSLKYWEKGP